MTTLSDVLAEIAATRRELEETRRETVGIRSDIGELRTDSAVMAGTLASMAKDLDHINKRSQRTHDRVFVSNGQQSLTSEVDSIRRRLDTISETCSGRHSGWEPKRVAALVTALLTALGAGAAAAVQAMQSLP